MALRSRRNTTRSGNASNVGEATSRLDNQENLDEYDMLNITTTIHALPLYPTSVLHIPYPKGYETTNLILFYERNSSPKQYISPFIDALGLHVDDCNICPREFLKSLTDRAYTWYTTLAPAEGWGDDDANLIDFSLILSDKASTIDMSQEYNEGTSEEQLFNQEMMAVTLYSFSRHGSRLTLVDIGSSVNILPLSILTVIGVPTSKVVSIPKDEFPLPNMEIVIDSTSRQGLMSFMYGFSEYNQIKMSTKDVEKTTFRMLFGQFYYTVMPFGLKNASVIYQRAMTAVLYDTMRKEVNDLVAKSNTMEGH
ncbi:reverse transcriptase [Pyrus ussuriensis x Pyrus communis]|uniref:Reverse transcriptase n=1 Tax=Pyrus ussuriensis x Pyrus communis TaxID=2448454 RepID=A0A5N5GPH5_9ROSA|nr:reverse transcriptase [Pyrus ussuriensis x Pyrus communis]